MKDIPPHLQQSLREEMDLLLSYIRLRQFYNISAPVIIAIGIVGNLLGLATLLLSRQLRAPHFLFYRTLTSAELLYCVNFFINKFAYDRFTYSSYETSAIGSSSAAGVESPLGDSLRLQYSNLVAGVYCSYVSHLISSGTGYLILYTTIAISIERFLALWFSKQYRKFSMLRRRKCIIRSIIVFIFLSIFVNSWAVFVEKVQTTTVVTETLLNNSTITLYTFESRTGPKSYLVARQLKNFYNGTLRMLYPLILLILTLLVICGYIRFRRRHSQIASPINQSATTNQHAVHHPERKQSILLYLMIAVVVLAFCQVVPTEAMRIINVLYPPKHLDRQLYGVKAFHMTLEQRRHLLHIFYYGHMWMKVFAHLGTFIDRSLPCYLYVLVNRTFRAEIWNLLTCRLFIRHARRRSADLLQHCGATNNLIAASPLPSNNGGGGGGGGKVYQL